MPKAVYKFIDLFAGVGGFRIALEKLGLKCVFSSEVDKYARAVYEYQWEKPEGDIREINAKDIPDHDILCGGFPCQSFSIAGKRKGFQDIRGTLFAEIVRVAQAKKPRLLFLENVKGLFSADNGRCFATILLSLAEVGYSLEWEVLNSKNFGVPQNRERVFIIGHLGREPGREVFPIGKSEDILDKAVTIKQGRGERVQGQVFPTIDARYGALRNAGEPYLIQEGHIGKDQMGQRVYSDKGIATAIRGEGGGRGGKTGLYNIATGLSRPSRGTEPRTDGLACTLKGVPTGSKNQILIDSSIRRLTPIECERLQGFPDDWTKKGILDGKEVEISDTQRYRQLGNAVTVPVIETIGIKMIETFI